MINKTNSFSSIQIESTRFYHSQQFAAPDLQIAQGRMNSASSKQT